MSIVKKGLVYSSPFFYLCSDVIERLSILCDKNLGVSMPCPLFRLMKNFRLAGVIAAALMIVGVWWLVIDHTEVFAIGVGLLVSVFIGSVVIDLWDE